MTSRHSTSRAAARVHARARSGRFALAVLLVASVVVAIAQRADAHTPHDTITGVAVSPSFARDGKVFVVAASRLLVSSAGDPYGFKPILRGLPRAPEAGESLVQVTIAPSDPKVMYVSSRIGGVFKSIDGGESWRPAANGIPVAGITGADVTPIQVSPDSAATVLAGGSVSGFYRTTDGGAHWSTIAGFGRVPAIAFVPGTAKVVAGDGQGRVAVSDDDGATWKVVAHSPNGQGGINTISVSGTAILAGTTKGTLLRSTDGGASFSPIGSGLPAEAIDSIALSPAYASDHTAWIATYTTGIYRSTDGGASWQQTSQGLTTDPQAQAVHVSEFRQVIVAPNGTGGNTLFEAGFDGLFRSEDNGTHWWTVETLVDYISGLAVSPTYADDSTVAVATYVKGAYISTNAGKTWTTEDNGLRHVISAGNKFAPVKRLHNIVFSPDYAKDHTIFSATWSDFLKSTDGGKSWATIAVTPPSTTTLLRQFVIGLSPHYTTDHTIYLGTRQGDIFKSTGSGDTHTWQHVAYIQTGVRSFAFDPSFPARPVIYAGTQKGIVESVDGGKTWVDSFASNLVQVAISPRYDTDGTVFAATLSGLFVTHDKGRRWSVVTTGPLTAASDVEAIALSPDYVHDHTILISIDGQGLYRSTDSGKTFTAIGTDLTDANRIIADFTNPTGTPIQFSPSYAHDRTIFAYSGQEVLRSTDAGATWTALDIPSGLDYLRRVDPTLLNRYDPAIVAHVKSSGSHHSSANSLPVVLAVVVAVLLLLLGGYALLRRRRRNVPTADASRPST